MMAFIMHSVDIMTEFIEVKTLSEHYENKFDMLGVINLWCMVLI